MITRAIYVVPGLIDEAKARADAERLACGDVRNPGIVVEVHYHRAGYAESCNDRCYIQTPIEGG